VPGADFLDQDASPAHRHKAWLSLLAFILAVVPDSAAACRFVRGDLVVIFVEPELWGFCGVDQLAAAAVRWAANLRDQPRTIYRPNWP
jgi:hypothetical protein